MPGARRHRWRNPGDLGPADRPRRVAYGAGSSRPLFGGRARGLAWRPSREILRRVHGQAEGRAGAAAGVACTASLASDRPKHGAHRIHVAAQTAHLTAVASVELAKGARDRRHEEVVAARMLLNMVAQACGLPDRLALELQDSEHILCDVAVAPPAWQRLFAGESVAVLAHDSRRVPCGHQEAAPGALTSHAVIASRRVLFPGAFHPLHDGHRAMARLAGARLGAPVEWELSITNVDKAPLDFREMHLRCAQFPPDVPLWLTRAPTFVEKVQIFPGATFVVGADTIARIAEPRYYHDDRKACQEAIAAIAVAKCRFLVFGRKTADGFETLSGLRLVPALRAICDEVSAEEYRADVSSTELRQADLQH